jgi:hypothetical protein
MLDSSRAKESGMEGVRWSAASESWVEDMSVAVMWAFSSWERRKDMVGMPAP